MRVIIANIKQWYIVFSAAFFLFIALIAGMLQPVMDANIGSEEIQPIRHGTTEQQKVAFACNVFWGEEFFPDLLRILDENNCKITFFIGGSWAKRYPDVLHTISDRGHELGNHSYSHPHPNTLNKEKNIEQILKTEELIKEITGVKTNLYAPPYGEYNSTVLLSAREAGYKTTLWSIDTIDWQRPTPEIIRQRVLKKIHNGAIILIHPTEPTVKALPELIREIKNKGYEVTTVSNIL